VYFDPAYTVTQGGIIFGTNSPCQQILPTQDGCEGWVGPRLNPCVADVDDGTGTGTPDGGVTIDDLLFFLAHFAAGC